MEAQDMKASQLSWVSLCRQRASTGLLLSLTYLHCHAILRIHSFVSSPSILVTRVMAHLPCSCPSLKLTSIPGKTLQHSYLPFLITTISHMESTHDSSHWASATRSDRRSHLDTDRSGRTREQPRSSPLPQREWSAPASPHRSRHIVNDQRPTSQDVYMPRHEYNAQNLQPSSKSRQRSRKQRIRDLLFKRDETEQGPHRTDFSPLYPHLNPYDNRFSVYSAPDDPEHDDERLRVATVSPFSSTDPSPFNLPRSPTYPPATIRSRSYNSVIDDAALTDAEEFHLFVQATVGLGLDDEASQPDSEPSPVSTREPQGFEPSVSIHHTTSGSPISPLEEASSTIRAMQYMAQIPDGSHIPSPNLTVRSQPSRVVSAPVQLTVEDFEDLNEDLPDYEESQTQAWSSRRAEATRRAQELQLRWRLTGARRGVM